MTDKRQVKQTIRQLQRVKTWQLLVILLLLSVIAATFLRLNNIGMIQRREAVLSADKTGDTAQTQARLYELQRYVSSHMNADMGMIYLEGQYQRDSQKRISDAANTSNPNGNVFKKAQDTCAPRFSSYSQAYLQCVLDELNRYAPADNLASNVAMPKVDAYRHSFVSPRWSPDFAGFSVLICVALVVVIVVRLLGLLILRGLLKFRNREP